MKKLLPLALAAILILAALSGCGAKQDKPAPNEPTEAPASAPAARVTKAPSGSDPTAAPTAPAEASYASLEEYVATDEFKSVVSSGASSEIELLAEVEEGSTVVITYKYLTDYPPESMALITQIWNAAMIEDGPMLTEKVQQAVKVNVGVEDCGVVIRLADKDGNALSQFPAE